MEFFNMELDLDLSAGKKERLERKQKRLERRLERQMKSAIKTTGKYIQVK